MDILGSESFDKLLSPNPPRVQSGFVNGNKRSRHGGVPRQLAVAFSFIGNLADRTLDPELNATGASAGCHLIKMLLV